MLVFIGLVLWTVWNDAIKPRLIPAGDIDRVADDIIASCADPEEEAFARHEHAWCRSDGGRSPTGIGLGRRSGVGRLHFGSESRYVPDMFDCCRNLRR